ncbi:MAG: hypothetical protein J0M02_17155, partial [Planctomycetes bacterium]|nr:hypothetical protein [Planctomycetota bacterium]
LFRSAVSAEAEARARAEKALAALPDDPYAALATVERLLADPEMKPAAGILGQRRDALRRTIEERRRTQLTATLDAAFQDASAGRLNDARTGLGNVPDEAWIKTRRSEVAARIELSERTAETRLAEAIPLANDPRGIDVLSEEIRRAQLSPARAKGLTDRLEARRRELAAAKAQPKMQKADTAPLWRALGETVEAARGALPYSALADAARNAAGNLPDGERQHAEALAEVAEAAQGAETALRLHIGQVRPRVECRIGNRNGTYLLTRLEKDRIGMRLVDAPAETVQNRADVVLPWAQLLSAALHGAGKERSQAAFLWYWRLDEARQALEAIRDDPLAVAIATYERRTRPLDIAGDQQRRKDGIIAVSYPFHIARDPGLLAAWKGDGATLADAGMHWESTGQVPRGSSAEADLPTLRWQASLRAPAELEARVIPDADSEVILVGLAAASGQAVRVALNTKLRRAFIIATRDEDKDSYQPHGAKGTPDYDAAGTTVRLSVDAAGKVSAWIDDRPVPGDRDLVLPADARLAPVIQGRPVQSKSALIVRSLSFSGRN